MGTTVSPTVTVPESGASWPMIMRNSVDLPAPLAPTMPTTAPGGTQAPPRRVPRNPEGETTDELAWITQAVEQVTQSTFVKRYGTVAEQVAPILFLASDEASYITGSVLPVAGGDLG